jgi:hypothetical protein
VKLHACGDAGRGAKLVRRVREAFPDVTLMHDAEGRYTREEGEAVARACADADARWFEALPDLDLEGYRRLRRAVPDVLILPGGDAIWDARLAGDLLRDPPWDAVFDVSFACGHGCARADGRGGRRRSRRRADQLRPQRHPGGQPARPARLRTHVLLRAGRAARAVRARRAPAPAHGQDGLVHAPEGPGLGIELDDETIDDATIAVATAVACTTRKEHCRCGSRDGAQS